MVLLSTQEMDGSRERLRAFVPLRAGLANWCFAITVDGERLFAAARIDANATAHVRYTAPWQQSMLMPTIDPEVLMDGTQWQAQCQTNCEALSRAVFKRLMLLDVVPEEMILKLNTMLSGLASALQGRAHEFAHATAQYLRRLMAASVPGIMFFAGGHSVEMTSGRLNAADQTRSLSLPLSYFIARALQRPAWRTCSGGEPKEFAAGDALRHREPRNFSAWNGDCRAVMESQ
jgi:fructose-bisphosphate aldolase class I